MAACVPACALPNPSCKCLIELMLQYPRCRLYKEPLQWTRDHLELMCCSFKADKTDDNGKLEPKQCEPSSANDSDMAKKKKPATNWDPIKIQEDLEHFIGALTKKNELHFFFDHNQETGKFRQRFSMDGAWVLVDGPVPICCVDLNQVNLKRKESNIRVQVSKKGHDPFIAAVAIAMAQRLAIEDQADIPSTCRCFYYPIHIIVYPSRKSWRRLRVYTVCISDALLELIDYPYRRPTICDQKSCFKLNFQISRVAFEPYDTLPSRLWPLLKERPAVKRPQSSETNNASAIEQPQSPEIDNTPRVKQPQSLEINDMPRAKRPQSPEIDNIPRVKQPQSPKIDNMPRVKQPQSPEINDTPHVKRPQSPEINNMPRVKRPQSLKIDDMPRVKRRQRVKAALGRVIGWPIRMAVK